MFPLLVMAAAEAARADAEARAAEARAAGGSLVRDGTMLVLTLPCEAERMADPMLWPRDPPIRVRQSIPDSWIELTIREGRNRQVRRMTAAVGHPTLRLVRRAIGEWTLNGLALGTWREVEG